MNLVNQKIIDAVVEKAKKLCPDSLALIAVYGSVATGDEHEKSDLDLLILIENEEGRKLSTGFILDDRKVGYDIYCTDWNGLRYDAQCHHAQIAKLMDSQIVYVNKQQAYEDLMKLRAETTQLLQSEERFQRVDELLEKAKIPYANACLSDEPGQVRVEAMGVMYYLLNALMIYHGTYFKRGVKRTFEELAQLPLDAEFAQTIEQIVVCKEVAQLRELLKKLLLYVEKHTRREKAKAAPSAGLQGTYEEMFSNWRNKVEEAAARSDAFSSYMNLCSLQLMLAGIGEEVEMENLQPMSAYAPDDLHENIRIFDQCLQQYEKLYERAGIAVKRYAHVDEFLADYLS